MSEIKKIAQVITKCNDCKHSTRMEEQKGGSFFALVCNFQEDKEQSTFQPFLIGVCTSDAKHTHWTIPPQCPLEDYNK